MSEDSGFESLEETLGADVEGWDAGDPPAYPLPTPPVQPAPAPTARTMRAVPPPRVEAPAIGRTSEDETLAKIIESLGGRDQARRLTLSVKRRRRGEPWKQLRPIPIEDWMAEEGLTAPEVIGDQFGNGTYKWELRIQGRYSRSGSCDLEGFDHVPDEKILSEDEFMGPSTESQAIPVGELVQGAVAAAMQPMAELVGSLRGDLTAILSAKLQAPVAPPAPPVPLQPDPALQTLIGILAQQNTALFELVGKSFTERANPVHAAPTARDIIRSEIRNMKELAGIAHLLHGPGVMMPRTFGGAEDFVDEEVDEEIEDEIDEEEAAGPPLPTEAQSATSRLFGRVGETMQGAAERMLNSAIRIGEEKLQSELLGSGDEPIQSTGTGELTGSDAISPELLREMEQLLALVDHSVRKGITPEEFASQALTLVPEQFRSILQTGAVGADELILLSQHLQKPTLSARLAEPPVRAWLARVLELASGRSTAH